MILFHKCPEPFEAFCCYPVYPCVPPIPQQCCVYPQPWVPQQPSVQPVRIPSQYAPGPRARG